MAVSGIPCRSRFTMVSFQMSRRICCSRHLRLCSSSDRYGQDRIFGRLPRSSCSRTPTVGTAPKEWKLYEEIHGNPSIWSCGYPGVEDGCCLKLNPLQWSWDQRNRNVIRNAHRPTISIAGPCMWYPPEEGTGHLLCHNAGQARQSSKGHVQQPLQQGIV